MNKPIPRDVLRALQVCFAVEDSGRVMQGETEVEPGLTGFFVIIFFLKQN